MIGNRLIKNKKQNTGNLLLDIYQCLYHFYGPLNWWPGDSPLEVMVGAILTQNTNWKNVQKALYQLKKEKLLDIDILHHISEKELSQYIVPCGYYQVKARRLKNFIHFFYQKYEGSVKKMFSVDWQPLRVELLSINGIGPETADSILLYAGEKPTFVVDAYTRRIFGRHQWIPRSESYQYFQEIFINNLPSNLNLYREFHAQIVMVGKQFCKKANPDCKACPLYSFVRNNKRLCNTPEFFT